MTRKLIRKNLDLLPKAFSNCYGLLLIIIVLGFSLVDVPKKLGKKLDRDLEYKHKLIKVTCYNYRLEELQYELEFKLEAFKNELGSIDNDYLKGKFEQLVKSLPFELKSDIEYTYKEETKGKFRLERIETDILEYIHVREKYERTVEKAIFLHKLKHPELLHQTMHINSNQIHLLRIMYYRYMRLYVVTPIYAVSIILSLVIVLMEFLNCFNFGRHFMITSLEHLDPSRFLLMFNIFLCYGCYIIIHGVLKSKFQGFKGLSLNNHTDTQSIITFSRNISRMIFPMCFNILQILQLDESGFRKILGRTDNIPLFGETFMRVAPIILFILILLKFFDIYSKVMLYLGIKDYDANNLNENREAIEEGKVIILEKIKAPHAELDKDHPKGI